MPLHLYFWNVWFFQKSLKIYILQKLRSIFQYKSFKKFISQKNTKNKTS